MDVPQRRSETGDRKAHPGVGDHYLLAQLIGTGRCGSTMVSNLLRAHPDVLSVSELFGFIGPQGRGVAQVTGPEMWAILSNPHPRESLMLRHGIRIPEYLYRLDDDSRFSAETGVPPILLAMLPHLTDEYYTLYEDVRQLVEFQPPMSLAEHLRSLFSWLAFRFGKRVCVERSGASLTYVGDLLEMFPDVPRVHLVRDGRDCAISMSRHQGFRLLAIGSRLASYIGADPYYEDVQWDEDWVPPPLRSLLPDRFDVGWYMGYDVPLEEFGALWSKSIVGGLDVLQGASSAKWRTLTYEQFVAEPADSLIALCSALGLDEGQEAWAQRAATAVVRGRGGTWRRLEAKARRRLEQACEPGFAALAGIGVDYS